MSNESEEPPEDQVDLQVDAAFAAYLKACDDGEPHSREEFIDQFPELADKLTRLMEVADTMEQIFQTKSSDPSTPSVEDTGDPKDPLDHEAETIVAQVEHLHDSKASSSSTLPFDHRPDGDTGPTLPFELGDYRLEKVLGKGGMGVVYLAHQRPLDRLVAVKMIRSGILAGTNQVRRFYAEARASAKLRHPNIVAVYQFGYRASHYFFSMEYVRGTDLAKCIAKKPLDPEKAVRYVRDVARAIEHAHRAGLLHRDLKPANVLIDQNDQVHVTDFGLSKQVDADSSLTGSGVAIGTPSYMAPEQARGHSDRATVETDVYALGAILYACLTGRPPFSGETVVQTLMQVIHNAPPKVRDHRPDAPVDIDTVCSKCLEKEPCKRYPSAAAFADDLDRFLEGRPLRARRQSPFSRTVNWIHGIPLVSALTGRRLHDVSTAHRRFQAGVLMLVALCPFLVIAAISIKRARDRRMPSVVHIAGGMEGGIYGGIASAIADRLQESGKVPVVVSVSGGSIDNREKLRQSKVHLAPMQASAISGSELCVAAPLFYEAVHFLVRGDLKIAGIADLAGHTVAMGPAGSGSRLTSELILDSYDLGPEAVIQSEIDWSKLRSGDGPDVALICIGVRSSIVSDLLADGWQLRPIANAVSIGLEHPVLRAMTINATDFPGASLPQNGIETLGTMAYLAVRVDAANTLVRQTLEALYRPPALIPGMISKQNAAEWQGLSLHRAARDFYFHP